MAAPLDGAAPRLERRTSGPLRDRGWSSGSSVAADQQVRQALIAAARQDQNPAVRMKALESLRDASADDDVRQALLDALQHDANPGVRVEAVNVLVGSLQHRDSEETVPEAPEATPV